MQPIIKSTPIVKNSLKAQNLIVIPSCLSPKRHCLKAGTFRKLEARITHATLLLNDMLK